MARFVLKRAAVSLLVLFGLSLVAFFLVRLVPGDTVTAMLGHSYTHKQAEALREKYGLDQPQVVQYAYWIRGMTRGDLGTTAAGKPVTAVLARAIPVTAELAGLALIFAVVVGIPLGMLAARRAGGLADAAVSVVSLAGLSVPGFWVGTMLILGFALGLGVLPSGRSRPLMSDPLGNLQHMAMPAVALGLAVMAVLARMTRSAMLEVLGQDYVRTAVAKGLPPRTVMWKHVARNGILPVLTVAGLQVGYLLGGSIVIEEVFSLSGIGAMILRALGNRDYALLQAAIMLIGGVFLGVNFIVDVLYAWADPRLSLE